MELFEKIMKSWKPLTIFAKTSILDIWQDSDYASDFSLLNLILNSFSSTWDFMAYTLTLNITTSLLYGCSFYVLVLVLFITIFFTIYSSLVIRQKSESQNGCFKKTKQAKFSEKRTFLTPWYAHIMSHSWDEVSRICFCDSWSLLEFSSFPNFTFLTMNSFSKSATKNKLRIVALLRSEVVGGSGGIGLITTIFGSVWSSFTWFRMFFG